VGDDPWDRTDVVAVEPTEAPAVHDIAAEIREVLLGDAPDRALRLVADLPASRDSRTRDLALRVACATAWTSPAEARALAARHASDDFDDWSDPEPLFDTLTGDDPRNPPRLAVTATPTSTWRVEGVDTGNTGLPAVSGLLYRSSHISPSLHRKIIHNTI